MNIQDFEKTLEFAIRVEHSKVEEEKPTIPFPVTKLRSSEPEFRSYPIQKSQSVQPLGKSVSERRADTTKSNPNTNSQIKYPTFTERKPEFSSHVIERKPEFSTHSSCERKVEEVVKSSAFRTAKDQLVGSKLLMYEDLTSNVLSNLDH